MSTPTDPGFGAVVDLLRKLVLELQEIKSALSAYPGPASGETDGEERLWKAREAADYLGLSLRTVRQLSSDGQLPCLRIGNQVRFDPESVKRWARSNGQHPPSGPAPVVPMRARRSV